MANPASAAATCSLSSGTLSVGISGSGSENVNVTEEASGTFRVSTFSGSVTCTGGPATTANTEQIEVVDSSVAGSSTTLSLWGLPFLEATDGEGDGTSEVEVKLDMGAGNDDIRFFALGGPVDYRLGTLGMNTNANETTDDLDVEVANMADIDTAAVGGTDSGDVISGAGSEGTGTAFPKGLRIDALGGADQIRGGTVHNILFPNAGDDTVDCGGGVPMVDTLDYSFAPPIRVDLQADRATGEGTDTIIGACENVGGSSGPDVLRGEAGGQFIFGRGGNDVVEGRGGNDALAGGHGGCTIEEGANDTLSYSSAPDGVNVFLDLTGGTGGSTMTGTDTICDIDNIVGGNHDDFLLGDGTPNNLVGRGGEDSLAGRGGPDTANYASNPSAIEADLGAGTVHGASTDTVTSVEHIVGTRFVDRLEGDEGANRLRGLGSNDWLVGLAGRDFLDGGVRRDLLVAGAGRDRLLGRAGADVLDGGSEVDRCNGGPGRDTRRRCERGSG